MEEEGVQQIESDAAAEEEVEKDIYVTEENKQSVTGAIEEDKQITEGSRENEVDTSGGAGGKNLTSETTSTDDLSVSVNQEMEPIVRHHTDTDIDEGGHDTDVLMNVTEAADVSGAVTEKAHDQSEALTVTVTETGQSLPLPLGTDKLLRLPLSRVKNIMKMDPEVTLASQEAVATLAKAAELFIMAVSQDAIYKTLQSKRKTLLRKDLEHVFDTKDCYAFLEGCMEL